MAVKSKVVDIVVIDSVAALTPRAEIEGVMGDSHVGLQARMMSQALRILTHNISDSNTTVIFINQLREKIGVMFGNPETTTGGKALKFYASIRLDIRRREVLKEGTEAVGHTVKVKVVKNKLAPPLKECFIDLIYGLGISREAEIVTLGVDCGFIKKSGAWYYFPDELGCAQGKENARLWLTEHSVVANELEARIKEKMMTSPLPVRSVSPSPLAGPVDLVGPGTLEDLVPVTSEEK
jgi:recombination protein RecA